MKPIYLDYNATTPIEEEVAEAMFPYLKEYFGNPSSSHAFGRYCREAVDEARRQVAALINADAHEIVFTGSGSEANNLAIKGFLAANPDAGKHIITSAIEHPAVGEVYEHLQEAGYDVTILPVDHLGLIDPPALRGAIRPDTSLISIMHANNEVGSIQPIGALADIAREKRIAFHTDAAQSLGKIPVDVRRLGVDMLTVVGHKLYTHKGIGALYVRDGVSISKQVHGASHERNRRAGTENVLQIVGLGKACEIAARDLQKNEVHMRKMRDRLQAILLDKIADARVNGLTPQRLPNTLSISFPGLQANMLLAAIPEVAASTGAACHADQVELSATLKAMQVDEQIGMGTVRLSTGRFTTAEEIDRAAEAIITKVKQLRSDA